MGLIRTLPLSLARALGLKRVALLALVGALLGGGWLWFRSSSLVAVEKVTITGVSGPGASDIETALTSAARRMSTLHVNVAALRAAVAPFQIVSGLSVGASFPHGLRIAVVERPAVAALAGVSPPVPLAADGTVLTGAPLPAHLPTLSAGAPVVGARVEQPRLLAELTVLGAAPALLRAHVARVFTGPEGITAVLIEGPVIIFGDDSLPHAKWLAAARVLADTRASGVGYVDVREPSRPAAGLPAGAAGTAAAASSAAQGSAATAGQSTATPGADPLSSALDQAVAAGGHAPASGGSSAGGAGSSSGTAGGGAASGTGQSATGGGQGAPSQGGAPASSGAAAGGGQSAPNQPTQGSAGAGGGAGAASGGGGSAATQAGSAAGATAAPSGG